MSSYLVLRAWDERVIVQENGSRIVHYMLRDSIGNSILAVVGKERSINHMAYTISEDFLRVFGSTSIANAGTMWRAKQEVVAWLISVASSGGQIFARPSNPPVFSKWEPTPKILKVEKSSPQSAVKKSEGNSLDSPNLGGTSIELLSQDSGLRGCWFRCKILHSSQNHLKVQYKDVLEVDGPGKLKEWVPASTVAASDKLGMRHVGRLTVRPQPHEDSPGPGVTFKVGAAVDAWWCNGWWEGVVLEYETLTKSNLQVYLPDESRFLTVERRNIRPSRDWIDKKWVEVRAKTDILSCLSLIFSTMLKLPPLPSSAVADTNASTNPKILTPTELERSQGDKFKVRSSLTSGNREAVKELHLKKRIIIEYNEEMQCRSLSYMDSKNQLQLKVEP